MRSGTTDCFRLGLTAVGVVAAGWLLAACHGGEHIASLTVTTTTDGADATPGDGVCEMNPGGGDCSLRAAIDEVNAQAAVDTVVDRLIVPAGTYTLTAVGLDDDNTGGDIDIAPLGALTLDGEDAVIDAAGAEHALDVHTAQLNLNRVTVRGASDDGLAVRSGARGVVHRSSLHDNDGAGIHVAPGGEVITNAVTISTNGDGGVEADGFYWAAFTTVAANTGGGITGAGEARLNASVVGAQGTGADCFGPTVTSGGYNIDSDATCSLGAAGDLSAPPELGALSPDPNAAHVPQPGSPLIDSIPLGAAGCQAGLLDQTGRARPTGAGCERGAVEVSASGLLVNQEGDDVDSNPGDGICQDAAGPPDACSLRAAIGEANALPDDDTIAIVPGTQITLGRPIAGDNDDNLSGDLDITQSLTINGHGATVNAGALDRALHVLGAATVTIDHLTVTGGIAPTGAGIRAEPASVLTVDRSTITSNEANGFYACSTSPIGQMCGGEGGGAGIYGSAGTTISNSTISENRSTGGKGCYDTFIPGPRPVTVHTCEWSEGAGVLAFGGTIVNSTISGNVIVELGNGGGVSAWQPTTIRHTSIEDNHAPGIESPGATAVYGVVGSAALGATAIDGPTPLCVGAVTSSGFNVAADATCGLTQPSDLPLADPFLEGVLKDNGGPTPTHLPFANSPVLDAIPIGTVGLCDASTPTDQRGSPRPAGTDCDVGAVEGDNGVVPSPLALVVNHGGDDEDAVPGDGACQDVSGAPGDCSLRAAIDESNAWPTTDAITVASGVDPQLTIGGSEEDRNATGDLDLTDDVSIDGDGATLDANGLDRALHVHPYAVSPTVDIRDLGITGGSAGEGGGVSNEGGSVTVTNSDVSDNFASDHGGGLFTTNGELTIDRTTVSANRASFAGNGGGVHNGENSTLLVTNSTISDNSAPSGSALYDVGAMSTVTQSTVVGSTDDVAVVTIGSMTVSATILANPGPDCSTPLTSGGYNVSDDSSCGLIQVTDHPDTPPLLGPLADNGGPTLTRLPFADSPVVDLIPVGTTGLCDATTPTDQRGFPRPDGVACDVGAVEGHDDMPTSPLALVVNNSGDDVDSSAGDGVCQDAAGPAGACSLRAAISEANAWPADDTITIEAGQNPGLTIGGGDDQNARGDLDITDDVVIVGNGSIVDANGIDQVIDVRAGAVHLDAISITGGDGGISNLGTLTLTNSTVSGNSRPGQFGIAGGIYNAGVATLASSTISDNDAGLFGGGIWNDTGATLTITQSTVSGNSASQGGGIVNLGSATLTITSSTISANVASSESAISAAGSVTVAGSVISNAGTNCSGPITSGGYNVAIDTTCSMTHPTDAAGVDPLLGALVDNGGPTLTHLPLVGSPLLDAVPNGTVGLCDGTLPTDQRGQPRPANGSCDIGAVERQPTDP